MSLKTTTAIATLGVMLAGASAMATEATVNLTIDQLPEKGTVTLEGSVDEVNSKRDFILRDSKGNTIDVEANYDLTLNEGDRVEVTGAMDSELMGMGQEIDAATVTVLDASDETTHSFKPGETTLGNKIEDGMEKAGDKVKATTAAVGEKMETIGSDIEAKADAAWEGEVYSAVKDLPEKGNVSIAGTVDSVDGDGKRFILKDAAGETIDVKTKFVVSAKQGDRVKINGMMQDEVANMGDEILASRVQILSQR